MLQEYGRDIWMTCLWLERYRVCGYRLYQQDGPTHPFYNRRCKSSGSIPFLYTLVMPQSNNSLIKSVYRKPIHTDVYLQWDSHHHLAAKFSAINTLEHRAKAVCSNNQLLKEENYYLRKALQRCKYPVWALNRANMK